MEDTHVKQNNSNVIISILMLLLLLFPIPRKEGMRTLGEMRRQPGEVLGDTHAVDGCRGALEGRLGSGHLDQTDAQGPHVGLAPIPTRHLAVTAAVIIMVVCGPAHDLRTHVYGGADGRGVLRGRLDAVAVQRHQSRAAEVRELDAVVVDEQVGRFYVLHTHTHTHTHTAKVTDSQRCKTE